MTVLEPTVLTGGKPIAERSATLVDGADRLRATRKSILRHPQFLVTLASSLMTLGITAIILGWLGAANTILLEEQVPYLISGGLLGMALSIIGALLVFTHWLTVSVRENREHAAARRHDHAELIEARRHDQAELIEALRAMAPVRTTPVKKGSDDGRTRSTRAERPLRGSSGGS